MTPTDPADPGADLNSAGPADPDAAPQRAADGRFLKGSTGNRKGRAPGPQGQPGLTPPLRRRVSTEVGGKKRRLNIVDAVMRQLGDRALAGDLAASREFLRLAQAEKAAAARAAREEAEARAWEEENAPLPKLRFNGGRNPSPLERVLFTLGAATEGETETMGNGDPYTHLPTLAQWVVDAAHARDPGLAERLTGGEQFNVERALRGWRAVE